MININERRISSMTIDEIKEFIKQHPNSRIIHLYARNGEFEYTTFQNERLCIEHEYLLRGYYTDNKLQDKYDYNCDLRELKYTKGDAYLCVNENEFEDMVESFMNDKDIVKKLTSYNNKQIELYTKRNNKILSETKWYDGLH